MGFFSIFFKRKKKKGGGLKLTLAEKRKLYKNVQLDVGFLKGTKYPDGKPVAQIAAYQEYGTPKIPVRPFMRYTFAEKRKEWAELISKNISDGSYKAAATLGRKMKEDIKETIITFSDPPNAPSTIKKKGFNDPLIDTGFMYESVKYRIKDKTGNK